MHTKKHLKTGARGEDAACALLKQQNFILLERNWRPTKGHGVAEGALELDIVAQDGDTLVFVEVKTRTLVAGSPFSPAEAFSLHKQNKILTAAKLYLSQHDLWDTPCRFDFIYITVLSDGSLKPEHLKNTMDFDKHNQKNNWIKSDIKSWQPW